METITNQVVAGTRIDAHGERNTKAILQRFADQYAGKRMPMNQQHDLSLASPGYVENLRVVPDESSPGDWSLVGDVSYEGDVLQIPVGGFSISFLEVLRRSKSQDSFHVYLPYPHYADQALLEAVFEEGFVSVGRWAKKAADPNTIALVGGVVIAAFAPIWDHAYKATIAPRVSRFFRENFKRLREKNIDADFIQHIQYDGAEIEVLLIPTRGREEHCFGIEKTSTAMFMVHEYLVALDRNHVPVAKVFLKFDEKADEFAFLRVELRDGTLAGV